MSTFSKRTLGHIRRIVKSTLRMKKLSENSKYLGNPLILPRKKSKVFQFLIEKLKNILASWKWAEWATLIKSSITCPFIRCQSFIFPDL